MLKKLFTLAAGAVTAAVAACGDAPRVTTRYMDPTGTWDEMKGAAARGPILAGVAGAPWGADAAAEQVILGHMARAITAYDRLRFTTDLAAAGHPDYAVRVAFNPPKSFPGRRLCEGEQPAVQPSERLYALAVFCQRGKVKAEVHGSVGGDLADLTPESEPVRMLMSQLSLALFQKARN
ncbi:hypothetical protein C882_2954 [Caenispirillum salinarum AK4]|uniref:Lipoprotein n=1 Tax=Caenispirillum salinarum AK4 TaxID=1238182 RepID=K9H0T2_9PROT|nr:hypothetical protein [Caenispirillum salinarum]EKV31890.1 hypothetical protein C882_2954 [Caenispirillum salinarum AK4]